MQPAGHPLSFTRAVGQRPIPSEELTTRPASTGVTDDDLEGLERRSPAWEWTRNALLHSGLVVLRKAKKNPTLGPDRAVIHTGHLISTGDLHSRKAT